MKGVQCVHHAKGFSVALWHTDSLITFWWEASVSLPPQRFARLLCRFYYC